MNFTFSIVTVLYRSDAVVFDMLRSVPPGIEIILVDNDNASPDLFHETPGVKYFRIGRNIGFGRACNYGAAEALGEFILFLNPDAILGRGFFDALSAAIRLYDDCSVFCAATYTQGELFLPTTTWIECQLNAKKLTKISSTDLFGDCCVRFANGGAFAIRRSIFIEMGGFDESIFLYFEDDDFSWRLLQRRQPIVLVSGAKVDHNLGTSTPPSCKLEFLRGYGKESSAIYLRQKYNLPDSPIGAAAKILKKVFLYTLSFNTRRLSHQVGRLTARIGWTLRYKRLSKKKIRSYSQNIQD